MGNHLLQHPKEKRKVIRDEKMNLTIMIEKGKACIDPALHLNLVDLEHHLGQVDCISYQGDLLLTPL